MTTILAVVGDTHINSTVGLCKYTHNLDDGGTYRSSKGQRWLWRNWVDFWDEIGALKHEVWTVLNGDIVEGDGKNRSHQLITPNDSTVLRMAIETLEPALEISKRVFVVRGTAAHVGLSASLEEKIAIDIGAEKCGEVYSWWELLLECESVLFDIRHHGPLGRLPWTRANMLNRRAVEIVLAYAKRRIPDVAIQSHNHHYATSSDEYPVKVYAQPAWQLASEFVHRIGIIEPANIGGMYFLCNNGGYEVVTRMYEPEGQRVWRAKSSPRTT